jgi:hypothetical protein
MIVREYEKSFAFRNGKTAGLSFVHDPSEIFECLGDFFEFLAICWLKPFEDTLFNELFFQCNRERVFYFPLYFFGD